MKEYFDIQRLVKLFIYEVTNYLPRFFKSLMIASGVLVAIWLLSLVVSENIFDTGREDLISFLYVLMLALSPYIIYKDMNNRKKGYMYAMIPASSLEKLISMLLVCALTVPAVVYLSLTLTDVLLYCFSQMGMGTFEKLVFFHPLSSLTGSFNSESVLVIDDAINTLSIVTTAMMFNSIFRKNKIFKTVLFNVTVLFAFAIIIIFINNIISPEFVTNLSIRIRDYFGTYSAEEIENLFMWVIRVCYFIGIAVTLGITYYRIKKVNY